MPNYENTFYFNLKTQTNDRFSKSNVKSRRWNFNPTSDTVFYESLTWPCWPRPRGWSWFQSRFSRWRNQSRQTRPSRCHSGTSQTARNNEINRGIHRLSGRIIRNFLYPVSGRLPDIAARYPVGKKAGYRAKYRYVPVSKSWSYIY